MSCKLPNLNNFLELLVIAKSVIVFVPCWHDCGGRNSITRFDVTIQVLLGGVPPCAVRALELSTIHIVQSRFVRRKTIHVFRSGNIFGNVFNWFN